MRNLLRPLALGLIGSCLLGAIGFVVTSLVVPDWKSQFGDRDYALASASVQGAQRCVEHPVERLLIQRFHIDELRPEQVTSSRNEIGQGALPDPGAALQRRYRAEGELQQTYHARVSAYTLFAVPIFTLSVTGITPRPSGNCERLRARKDE